MTKKLNDAARSAIPGLVRLISTIPPGWRAAISVALLVVFALFGWLAVRHGGHDWLPIIAAAAVAVLQAAFGAAGGDPPAAGPPGAPAGHPLAAGLLVALLALPGCAAIQQAARTAEDARGAVERACQLAVDVEAHCLLLREQTDEDLPEQVDAMCRRAAQAVALCGGD